jgi:xanthine/uracil permease
MNIRANLRKYRITIVGILIGAILGWVYWYFIGCQNGMCTIKSDPINMTLYGALLGGLLFDFIRGLQQKHKAE